MEALEAERAQKAMPPKVRTLFQHDRRTKTLALTSPFLAVWVCVAALAILDRLDAVDDQMLGWWLSERQLPNGGLNGRPEKLEDVRLAVFLYSC